MQISEYLEKLKPKIDSRIENFLPRSISEKDLERILEKAGYECDIEAINEAIIKPTWQILDYGGKRWRPAFFLLIVEALGGNPSELQDFAVIPELIHNGTLMVDDVEDNAELRRGKPCIHKIFGIDIAINAGNSLYFLPMILLVKNKDKFDDKTLVRAYEMYIEELTKLSIGQGTDIWWHGNKSNPLKITEKQYLQMCSNKTGCMARFAGRLAVILSRGTKEQEEIIGKFAETLGVCFQIQDDILDVVSTGKGREDFGKAFGNDITEGKKTLMVIHTLKVAAEDDRRRLIEILNMHTKDPKLIKEAIGILKKYDSIAYAKKLAEKLIKQAWGEVEPVLPESDAKQKLKSFADYLIKRKV